MKKFRKVNGVEVEVRDDDDNVMRDGEYIRTPLLMMDSVQQALALRLADHQPGDGGGLKFDQRDALRADADAAFIERTLATSNAWRDPPPNTETPAPTKTADDLPTDEAGRAKFVEPALVAHEKFLNDAWRQG